MDKSLNLVSISRQAAILFLLLLSTGTAFSEAPTASPTAAIAPSVGGLVSELRFNDATGLVLRGGAVIGPAGSGVSGQPDDKAYSADTATSPAAMAIPGGAAPLSGIEEIAVTAWYKPRTADLTDAQNLFNAFGSTLLWDGKIHQWMWRVNSHVTSNPKSATWYASGTTPQLITVGEWTFIALTWKRVENHADFYMGSKTATAGFARKVERNDPIDSATEGLKRAIGNDPKSGERAFNGDIDNVRFFTKALDAQSIESIRAADLKNEPVKLP